MKYCLNGLTYFYSWYGSMECAYLKKLCFSYGTLMILLFYDETKQGIKQLNRNVETVLCEGLEQTENVSWLQVIMNQVQRTWFRTNDIYFEGIE